MDGIHGESRMDTGCSIVSSKQNSNDTRDFVLIRIECYFVKYSVWVQLLDRKQQKLELVLLSIDNFCEPPPNTYNTENHFTSTSASVQVIYSEQGPIWINVNDLLYFLKSDDANEVKFIWGSEESEFRHLYLITSSIAGL